MKVIENFECRDFPRKSLYYLKQNLDLLAVERVPQVHYHFNHHTPIEPRKGGKGESFSFFITHQEENVSYTITIDLFYAPVTFSLGSLVDPEGHKDEGTLRMTLEAKTLGKDELKPSSIPALAEIIDEYKLVRV